MAADRPLSSLMNRQAVCVSNIALSTKHEKSGYSTIFSPNSRLKMPKVSLHCLHVNVVFREVGLLTYIKESITEHNDAHRQIIIGIYFSKNLTALSTCSVTTSQRYSF